MSHRVLFLCTGNSARSQMAEALLPLIGGCEFETVSAGTNPVGVNPATVEALREIGVEWQDRRSKHVEEFWGQSFDYVITVCDRAKETCPVFPQTGKLLHWSFDDPAAATSERREQEFRRVRDQIAQRLCAFLDEEFDLRPGGFRCYCC